MGVRSERRKKRITVISIAAGVVAVAALLITLLVYKVNSIFGEKPVPTEAVAVSPSPTPELWDPNQAPEIQKIVASSEMMSLGFSRVRGAGSYEISFRSEEGDWQQIISEETDCYIPINSGFSYHVRIRSVSPDGQYGPYSNEGQVSAEAVRPVLTVESKNGSSISFSWPLTREGAEYVFSYKSSTDKEWHEINLKEAKVTIGGLMKGKEYDFSVAAVKEDFATLRSEVTTIVPEGSDFGDPFMNAYGFLCIGDEIKSVPYTTEQGCLGLQCWAQFKTILYAGVSLESIQCEIPGGTALKVTADESGHYVCERENNRYALHVSGTIGEEEKEGWVLANALFVDLAMLFPQSNPYSIQYNRTNAYSSLFTCGGNARAVNLTSAADTRYDVLKAKDGAESLGVNGYNGIDGVTGKALANYGPKEEMPAVWDVAMQLLIAQSNALRNGRCLLIYEAYRPNATSKKVYSAMTGNGYFRETVEERNLANGFLNKNYNEAYFIANNSNHNRGIALDLTIMKYDSLDSLGKESVMQTKMHTLDYRCDMTYNNGEAKLLYSIMTTDTGLVPLRSKQEWWHFELNGDIAQFPCVKDYVYANYQI